MCGEEGWCRNNFYLQLKGMNKTNQEPRCSIPQRDIPKAHIRDACFVSKVTCTYSNAHRCLRDVYGCIQDAHRGYEMHTEDTRCTQEAYECIPGARAHYTR